MKNKTEPIFIMLPADQVEELMEANEITTEVGDSGRWTTYSSVIFHHTIDGIKKLLMVNIERGNTEYQECELFPDRDASGMVMCYEVEPVEVKVVTYKVKQNGETK